MHGRALGLAVALGCGAVLRLIWLSDIEYKADEDYSMHIAREVGQTEPWPATGMPSSVGIPNFGLSAWLFVFVGRVFSVETPPDLARGVAVLSIVAMGLYVPFVRGFVAESEREVWYWGGAMMAVNPLAVFLHRKIWPPALFPLFTLALLAGWLRREKPMGALTLGVGGALAGQLHMSGFFLSAAFVGWCLLFDRHSMRWGWWLLGSCVGALPILPWIITIVEHPEFLDSGSQQASWIHPLKGLFWIRWFVQPYGFDTLNHSLGSDFWDLMRYPLIGNRPTFLVAGLHLLSAMLFARIGLPTLKRWWRDRRGWSSMIVGRSSPTAFSLAAAFWGFGFLFAVTAIPYRYYYLLVSMPLMFVGAARIALAVEDINPCRLLRPRSSLFLLCVTQALISFAFLSYIHLQDRQIRGDYGIPYRLHSPAPQIGELSKRMRESKD